MERKFDEATGIPLPFSQQEHHEARSAFNAATDQAARTAILVKYPFLAGLSWRNYVPQPAPPTEPVQQTADVTATH